MSTREGETTGGQNQAAGWLTLLVAIACIAVVFEFLALQLQSGRDPALKASATARPRPRSRQRKIIITKVIPAPTGGTSRTTSSSGGHGGAPLRW